MNNSTKRKYKRSFPRPKASAVLGLLTAGENNNQIEEQQHNAAAVLNSMQNTFSSINNHSGGYATQGRTDTQGNNNHMVSSIDNSSVDNSQLLDAKLGSDAGK